MMGLINLSPIRSLSSGLINGGFGGLFWVFIGTVIAYSSIVASLAEMASMVPSSGGKYLVQIPKILMIEC